MHKERHPLESRGYRPIMLKGATITSWLYADPSQRLYNDLDILVPSSERLDVVAALREIGSRPLVDDRMLATSSPEEQPLISPHGVGIDLHFTLKGVGWTRGGRSPCLPPAGIPLP